MKLPIFLPPALKEHCKDVDQPSDLVTLLEQSSIENFLTFFECACEDETWTAGVGGPYIFELLRWLNSAYYDKVIDKKQAFRVVRAVQSHYLSVKPYIHCDYSVSSGSNRFLVSSVLFGGMSPFFHDKIRTERDEYHKREITLPDIKDYLFVFLEEGCYSGQLEYLWREEPKRIMELLKLASAWGLIFLEQYVAAIYKRYLARDNIVDHLLMACKESILELQKISCEFINEHGYGVDLEVLEVNQIKAVIQEQKDALSEIFSVIESYITRLSLEGNAAKNRDIHRWIPKIQRLLEIDLQNTEEVPESIVDYFPDILELNLSHCFWINDKILMQIFDRCPHIIRLNLSGNVQLSFRTWGALSKLSGLSILNVANCRSLNDEDLDLLASSCPNLVDLDLKGCEVITDQGILSLAEQCSQLESLSLRRCGRITAEGLIQFASIANTIEIFDLRKCSGVNETSLSQIKKLLPAKKIIF